MSQVAPDLRRHPRVSVDVQANVRTSDGRKLPARTRDLSRSGICLITTDLLKPGESLRIDLMLVFSPSKMSESLPLKARVVWCTPISQAFQIGALFEGLLDKEVSFLEMFIRYLDGSILPMGSEMEALDETSTPSATTSSPLSPDDKDNPFRY